MAATTATRLRQLGLSVPVSEVLDPKLWRERYAFGVVLGAQQQGALITSLCSVRGMSRTEAQAVVGEVTEAISEIPDHVIRWHLRARLSDIGLKLGLPMGVLICKADPTADGTESAEEALLAQDGLRLGADYDKVVPRLAYTHGDAINWYRIPLPSSLISVERVRAFYYGQLVWEFSESRGNTNLIRIDHPQQGGVHLLPINFESVIVTHNQGIGSGNYGVWHTLALHKSPVPDFWAVDYTLGPRDKQTGQIGHVPAVLADWVYAGAGITLLSIGGLAQSQGLSSSSLSFDGFSKSVSLQASAIYGINSALENVFKETQKNIDWKRLKVALKGIRIRPYSF